MRNVCLAAIAVCAGAPCAFAQFADGTAIGFDLRGTDAILSWQADDPVGGGVNLEVIMPQWDTFAMDIGPDGQTLYAVTRWDTTGDGTADTLRIGPVDLDDGTFTSNGDLAPAPNATGLSYDVSTDTWYLTTFADNVTTLYTVNVDDGSTVAVGPLTGGPVLAIDIAVDNCGDMYAHDISADELYSVDKTTGVCTLIGPTGLAANFAQGMDFDPVTNQLYAAVYTGGGTGSYGTFDLTTGGVNEIVDLPSFPDPLGDGVEMEMAIIGIGKCDKGCAADCNGDGNLDILDFVCFQGIFQNGDPAADCNGDGNLDILDFVCFQGQFQKGC